MRTEPNAEKLLRKTEMKPRPAHYGLPAISIVFTAGYCAVGLCGAFLSPHATLSLLPGVIEFHAGDYAVHLAPGLVFLVLGSLKRSDQRVAASR